VKLITFSLWGNDPKYCVGAIKNADLAKSIFPEWKCRFYVGESTDKKHVKKLRQLGSEVIEMEEEGDWCGMFWRFYAACEDDVEMMISRDADSRLGSREKAAVDEWVKSDKGFHIMRDHPWHGTSILGGMWGMKNGTIPHFKKMLDEREKQDMYDTDQAFLREEVYPIIEKNVMVHDEFFEQQPFPTEREGYQFVGQVFESDDTPVYEHMVALKNHLEK